MTTISTNTNILRRAVLTLLALIMTCAAAWAETVETYYIDENGTRHDVTSGGNLQIIDMLGRIITNVETSYYGVSTNGMAPGVYVLRLINGDDVKTQKIIIR